MESDILLIGMFLIYPLLIFLFNMGKYPSLPFSPKPFRRELGEAIAIFGVFLAVFWLRAQLMA